MVVHVRHVPECGEGNPGLRGGLGDLCSRGGLLGVCPKSHDVPHQLRMRRLMSIL